ncbi:MAG: HAMP domain-containing histidine kinase, partial [Lachnospiraceae bacterium]|nr:HAMP domain-containing histidine kinase [Lachnospiraceae bacterium]
MSVWNIVMAGIAAVCILLMIGMTIYVSHILDKLGAMLDSALAGRYEEDRYDESRLSRLEGKMARFLSHSLLSAKNIRKSQQNIQQTVSDLSHQTKTPIANIVLYTELLSERLNGTEEHRLVERIVTQTDKLDFLVQSLVKLSRLENDIVTVNQSTQPVQLLLEDVRDAYEKTAREKGITLLVTDSGAVASYDYKWTKEAIGNMVDNAVKYTPSGGHIRVSVKEYEMFVAIEVRDDGIGIEKWEQAH